jgi:hypothetical protein
VVRCHPHAVLRRLRIAPRRPLVSRFHHQPCPDRGAALALLVRPREEAAVLVLEQLEVR